MENQEEPSVLTLLTDFDTENHGLNVMRIALNYRVRTSIKRHMSLFDLILLQIFQIPSFIHISL